MEIELDKEDKKILESVKSIEESFSFLHGVVTFTPLLGLFTMTASTGEIFKFTFNFFTTDWEGHVSAASSIDKIKACSISSLIGGHLTGLSGDKEKFFNTIYKTYYDAC